VDADGVGVIPDNLADIVDVGRFRAARRSQGIVEGEVISPAVEEAVYVEVRIGVLPDDLARIVDPVCKGVAWDTEGNIDGDVSAAAKEEAVGADGIGISPDDLALGVDAVCQGAAVSTGDGEGVVEGGVSAAGFEEAVKAGGVLIAPDDLVRIIDPVSHRGASNARGVVEGVEDMDWHDTGSSDGFACKGVNVILRYSVRRHRSDQAHITSQ